MSETVLRVLLIGVPIVCAVWVLAFIVIGRPEPPPSATEVLGELLERKNVHEQFQTNPHVSADPVALDFLITEGWTPADIAFLDMFNGMGAFFGGGVTLPSGRHVTGEELYRWVGPPQVEPKEEAEEEAE